MNVHSVYERDTGILAQLDGMELGNIWFQQNGATCHIAHQIIIAATVSKTKYLKKL